MRHRPLGWPRHLKAKKLKNGQWAYYWELPPWAVKAQKEAQDGDLFRNMLRSAPLGSDLVNAIKHANSYNLILDDYRRFQRVEPHVKAERTGGYEKGTVDWMCEKYFASFDYQAVSVKQQGEYRKNLALARDFKMKSQRRFGEVPVSQLNRESAEKLYKLILKTPTGDRPARAAATIRALSVAWNVVAEREPVFFPNKNPFVKMKISLVSKETKAASYADLEKYVAAADELGLPAMGTAAMLAYEGLQREPDLIGNLFWADFHPGTKIVFRHRKTKKYDEFDLRQSDSVDSEAAPFAKLEARLLAMRRGEDTDLIILRDGTKDSTGKGLPYTLDLFQKHDRKIRVRAGLASKGITFTGFRHGGHTELADAGATESEIVAVGGRRGPTTLDRYIKASSAQANNAALKRYQYRQKQMVNSSKQSGEVSGTNKEAIVGIDGNKQVGTAQPQMPEALKKQGESKC